MDLGDGFKAMYVNLTLTGEPIRHHYENPGIYRVSVRAENMAGHDEAVLFVQVNCKSTVPLRRCVSCEMESWGFGGSTGSLVGLLQVLRTVRPWTERQVGWA